MRKNRKQVLVAGLGRFGSSVALTLENLGCEVLAIDDNEALVQNISSSLSYVVCGNAADEQTLRNLNAAEADVAVVAIGNLESNMMCTLLLKEMGVPKVVVKAVSELHGKMAEKIGADKVIHSETDMGRRLAHNLIASNVVDYLELSRYISVVTLELPDEFVGQNLIQADIRNRFNVSVVAIQRGDTTIANPQARTVFEAGDQLIVLGTKEAIGELWERL